jgi:hypothetical protein
MSLVIAAGFGEGEGEGVTELEGVGVPEGVIEGDGVPEGVSEGEDVGEGVGVDETPGAAHTVSLVVVQPAAVTLHVLQATHPPAAATVPVELHVEPATQA